MGNRQHSGMKLVPVSPSACETSSSSGSEEPSTTKSDIEVKNLGEYMLKKMKKYESSVAMVIIYL